jgi:hypothetical protein
MERPTGVTILAIVSIIGGLVNSGLGCLAFFGLVLSPGGASAGAAVPAMILIFGSIAYLLIIVGSLLGFVFGVGAWALKGWAWTMGIAANVIAVVALAIGILGAFVDLVSGRGSGGTEIASIAYYAAWGVFAIAVLWYLFRPHVKQVLGR